MNIALWVVQILLALFFLMAGVVKATRPKEQLATNMGWVEDFDGSQVKGIGVLEILGAFGLVLPGLFGILPILTPLAALGLALTMIGAAITHMRRNEYGYVVFNLIVMAFALFVAYCRFVLLPL